MANKIKYSIKNVHYAVASTGTTYGTPVAIPGAVSISLSPKGESNVFYADGIEYYRSNANGGYEGDLDVALIPDDFREDILKEIIDSNSVLIEKTGVETAPFALGFEIEGNAASTLFWFYNCTAERPEEASSTKEDSITPSTEKLTVSCSPDSRGYVRGKTTESISTTTRENWFQSVYVPAIV